MSDAMLFSVLRMPHELWRDDILDKIQRRDRYVQAADRIEEQAAEVKRLTDALNRIKAEYEDAEEANFPPRAYDLYEIATKALEEASDE